MPKQGRCTAHGFCEWGNPATAPRRRCRAPAGALQLLLARSALAPNFCNSMEPSTPSSRPTLNRQASAARAEAVAAKIWNAVHNHSPGALTPPAPGALLFDKEPSPAPTGILGTPRLNAALHIQEIGTQKKTIKSYTPLSSTTTTLHIHMKI